MTHQFDFELNLITQTNDFVIEVKDVVELNKLFWRTYQRELEYSHEGPPKRKLICEFSLLFPRLIAKNVYIII